VFVLEPGRSSARRVAPRQDAEDFDPAWSSDGKLAFVRSTPAERGFTHTILVHADGETTQLVEPSRLGFSEPAWAPDGAALAYLGGMTRSDIGGGVGLFVVPLAGGAPELLFGGASISSPRWSPDGKTIAFVAQRHRLEPSNLVVVDLTTREVRTVSGNVDFGTGDVAPAWSPGGDRLLFTRIVRGAIFAEHGPEVFTVRLDGSGLRRIAQNAFGLAWSPDGRDVLVVARYLEGEGPQALSIVGANGTGRRELLPLDRRTQGLDPIVGWRA
jgi:Tol biopolymer transport system component